MNREDLRKIAEGCLLIAGLCILGMPTLSADGVVEGNDRAPGTFMYPPVLSGAKVEKYKTVGETELHLWLYEPRGHQAADRRAAVVFFFGGGWFGGSPEQFAEQARYLASRGLVAILADYRVASRHQSTIEDSVKDARSAMRWVRRNAVRLGIDSRRIGASGGSAGGHLAAATAMLEEINERAEDTGVSAAPDALLLFNPALALTEIPLSGMILKPGKGIAPAGVGLDKISPCSQVRSGMPPTLVLNGRDDKITLFSFVQLFADRMAECENIIKVVGYDGEGHGFFNYGQRGNWAFVATMRQVDEFLASLGWIAGKPTLEAVTRPQILSESALPLSREP